VSDVSTIASRDHAVLLVVDVQARLAAAMSRREEVLESTNKLIRAAALVGVPIIVTLQYPTGLGDVEPTLRATLESVADSTSVLWVNKVAFDCFAEPAFVEALKSTGRQQLVIAGMESHICVIQTALSALRADFDVHVVGDGCCSRDSGSHASAIERARNAGAVITTTESVLYELVGEAGTDEFRKLLRIVKG
jgi:isochorismate hydrolase